MRKHREREGFDSKTTNSLFDYWLLDTLGINLLSQKFDYTGIYCFYTLIFVRNTLRFLILCWLLILIDVYVVGELWLP